MPTFVLMIKPWVLYVAAGALLGVHQILVGLEAVVVGIIFNVRIDMGQGAVQYRVQAVILLLSFTALPFKIKAVLIVPSALVTGGLFIRPAENGEI